MILNFDNFLFSKKLTEVPIDVNILSIGGSKASSAREIFEKENVKFDANLSRPINKKEISWTFKDQQLNPTPKYSLESTTDSLTHSLIINNYCDDLFFKRL